MLKFIQNHSIRCVGARFWPCKLWCNSVVKGARTVDTAERTLGANFAYDGRKAPTSSYQELLDLSENFNYCESYDRSKFDLLRC